MNDVSDAIATFVISIAGVSFVAAILILSRQSFLPIVDQWIVDILAYEKSPVTVTRLPANQPCYSGYQCQSGFCIKRGSVDDITLFSSGVCRTDTAPKGCMTEITLGLTTRTLCID